jgi:hypothetical protein
MGGKTYQGGLSFCSQRHMVLKWLGKSDRECREINETLIRFMNKRWRVGLRPMTLTWRSHNPLCVKCKRTERLHHFRVGHRFIELRFEYSWLAITLVTTAVSPVIKTIKLRHIGNFRLALLQLLPLPRANSSPSNLSVNWTPPYGSDSKA